MGRNNPESESDNEFRTLLAQYEESLKEGKSLYFDGDQLATIADYYATERAFNKAQEAISYGLRLHPGHTDLLIEQAYLYLDTNKLSQAKAILTEFTDRNTTEIKFLQAEILLNEGKLDEARNLLNSIDGKDQLKNIVDAAYLYIDMGYPKEALSWIESNTERYQDNESFLAVACDCYRNINELSEKAIFYHNRLIDLNPYNPLYWTGLSKCYFNIANYEQAIEAADFALAADETFGEAHMMRAHSYFQLNNLEETVKEYEATVKYKSFTPEYAYLCIGLAYCNHERWQEGLEAYNKALQCCDESSDASSILFDIYYQKATACIKLQLYMEAYQACNSAVMLSPQDTNAYLLLGIILHLLNEPEKAEQAWEKALQLSPDPETIIQIGNKNMEQNFVVQALACYHTVYQHIPDYPGLIEKMAVAYLMMGNLPEFLRFNQLAETPIDMETIQELITQSGNQRLMEALEKILNELRSEDPDSHTTENNNQ